MYSRVDLQLINGDTLKAKSQVCIVGSGAAGIYLANQISKQGVKVILIDAGNWMPLNSVDIGFESRFSNKTYNGAVSGRFFGIGGTTSHWGGALVPHSKFDYKEDSSANLKIWMKIVHIVRSREGKVLKELGYKNKSNFFCFEKKILKGLAFSLRNFGISIAQNIHLPFRRKNFKYTLSHSDNISVYFNSVVCDWKINNGMVGEILAKSQNGKELYVQADKFIISSGAIESTRILLEINKKYENYFFNDECGLGNYLSDHISIPGR